MPSILQDNPKSVKLAILLLPIFNDNSLFLLVDGELQFLPFTPLKLPNNIYW